MGSKNMKFKEFLDHRQENKSSKAYLVQWTGYGPEHDTWEPEAALQNCQKTVQAYWVASSIKAVL